MAIKVVCSLVFAAGMLAVLPGTASAQPFTGTADFCDDATNDNAPSQSFGLFTDLRRGGGINLDDGICVLKITGSTGSAGDMWITLLDSPGDPTPPPTFECVLMAAPVFIHRFDNRKAIGFVSNVQPGVTPGSGTGLFVGLYDNGNTDALTLSTFQDGKLTSTVGTLPLGSKIKEDVSYFLLAQVCNDGTNFFESGALVTDEVSFEEILFIPNGTPLPPGIASSGQIGIAGQAKSAFVDSGVVDFFFWNGF
jgi:hypothetical protein